MGGLRPLDCNLSPRLSGVLSTSDNRRLSAVTRRDFQVVHRRFKMHVELTIAVSRVGAVRIVDAPATPERFSRLSFERDMSNKWPAVRKQPSSNVYAEPIVANAVSDENILVTVRYRLEAR